MNSEDRRPGEVRELLINFIKFSKTLLNSWKQMFLLLPIILIVTTSSSLAAEASEETIETFKAVIKATKNIKHPETGKGSAHVETYVRNIPLKTEEAVIDFIFKGDMSRSVKSSIKEGKLEQSEVLWAVGEKCSVTYNSRGSASIQRHPPNQFYRQLGYDFNPNTFMQHYHTPLDVHLERLLVGPSTLSTKLDNEDILHLISDYKDPNTYQRLVVYVNPNMDHRMTGLLAIMERFDRPERNHTDFLEIQWGKYESSWYVKSAKWASYEGIHSTEDMSSLEPNYLRRSTAVEVTEFHPNVEISDSEFTLDGLKLPSGTSVVDRISGTISRIHREPSSKKITKEPLRKIEIPKTIQKEVKANNVKQNTTVIEEQQKAVTKKPEKEISIPKEKSMQETSANTHSEPHSHQNILMIGILSIGTVMVILVIAMGLKLLLSGKAG